METQLANGRQGKESKGRGNHKCFCHLFSMSGAPSPLCLRDRAQDSFTPSLAALHFAVGSQASGEASSASCCTLCSTCVVVARESFCRGDTSGQQ